jgi:hypothetical protein
MPRNVVTLCRRVLALATSRNRQTRERVESWAIETRRARRETNPQRLEIDFPKQKGKRAAKTQIAEALDHVDPRWRKGFVLYPTESALRQKGE